MTPNWLNNCSSRAGKNVRRVVRVAPVGLHLVVEVGGLPVELVEVVQHLGLVLVRPAVVPRRLAVNAAGGVVELVGQVGHAIHAAELGEVVTGAAVVVVTVYVVTVRRVVTGILRLRRRG